MRQNAVFCGNRLKCCLQFVSVWTSLKFCCLVMGYRDTATLIHCQMTNVDCLKMKVFPVSNFRCRKNRGKFIITIRAKTFREKEKWLIMSRFSQCFHEFLWFKLWQVNMKNLCPLCYKLTEGFTVFYFVLLKLIDMKLMSSITIYYTLGSLSKPRFGHCNLHAELCECFSTLYRIYRFIVFVMNTENTSIKHELVCLNWSVIWQGKKMPYLYSLILICVIQKGFLF